MQGFVGNLSGFVPKSDFSRLLDAEFSFQVELHWTRVGRFYSRAKKSLSAVGIPRSLSSDSRAMMISLSNLAPINLKSGALNVIIDTPKGSRNKFSWDEKQGLFALSGVLPAGAVFPYDFGFLPNTLGEDGDALDVLVLMDEPAFTGCLVPARVIGVIEAKQTEKGQTKRNDRLIAVAADSRTHQDLKALSDLNRQLVADIQHFFVSYNEAKGKKFKPLGCHGPARARKLIQRGENAKKTET